MLFKRLTLQLPAISDAKPPGRPYVNTGAVTQPLRLPAPRLRRRQGCSGRHRGDGLRFFKASHRRGAKEWRRGGDKLHGRCWRGRRERFGVRRHPQGR